MLFGVHHSSFAAASINRLFMPSSEELLLEEIYPIFSRRTYYCRLEIMHTVIYILKTPRIATDTPGEALA